MNNVSLTGRFARDPNIKYTNDGKTIARFTLACDRRFKSENGPTADFISCIAFGKTAEFIEKYFSKGMKMELSGRIQTGSYAKQDGTIVYTTDVIADQVGFCESKRSSQENQGSQHGYDQTEEADFMEIPDNIGDELPFS